MQIIVTRNADRAQLTPAKTSLPISLVEHTDLSTERWVLVLPLMFAYVHSGYNVSDSEHTALLPERSTRIDAAQAQEIIASDREAQ